MNRSLLLVIVFNIGLCQKLAAQSYEAQQLLLNVEKLTQLKQILTDMKKGYEIISSGYNTIKDLSEGNFSLHQTFLDGLLQVSPVVRNYKKTAAIIHCQLLLVREYKNAFRLFKQDDNFSSSELSYISRVYNNLFKKSLDDLDNLTAVITAGQLRMSDDERLQAIDKIFADMQDKLQFLRHFNRNTMTLAVQRAKERNDAYTIRNIYGITD